MRLFTVLVLIVTLVVGVGLYRGWFRITSASSPDKPAVTLTVDEDKIQQDKTDAQKKAHDLGQK